MLRHLIARSLLAGAAACTMGLAFTAAAAQALVSHTEITSPANHAVIVVNDATQGPQVTVTGRAPGASNGDTVNIFCTRAQAGKTTSFKKLNPTPIEVSNQSFSYTGSFKPIGYETCFLRAVPSGTEPADLTPFTGPQIAVDETQYTGAHYQIEGGPNNGDQIDTTCLEPSFREPTNISRSAAAACATPTLSIRSPARPARRSSTPTTPCSLATSPTTARRYRSTAAMRSPATAPMPSSVAPAPPHTTAAKITPTSPTSPTNRKSTRSPGTSRSTRKRRSYVAKKEPSSARPVPPTRDSSPPA